MTFIHMLGWHLGLISTADLWHMQCPDKLIDMYSVDKVGSSVDASWYPSFSEQRHQFPLWFVASVSHLTDVARTKGQLLISAWAVSILHMMGSNGEFVPLVCSLVCVHTKDYKVVYNNNKAAASLSASRSLSSDQCCYEKCPHNSRLILMILGYHWALSMYNSARVRYLIIRMARWREIQMSKS